MPENEALFGHIAVEIGVITKGQLVDATRLQNNPDEERPLGRLLIDLGWITPDQLDEVLEAQKRRKPAPDGAAAEKSKTGASARRDSDATAPIVSRGPDSVAAAPSPAARPAAPTETPSTVAPSAGLEIREGDDLSAASLDAILRRGVELGASDVHLHSGSVLRWRIDGRLVREGSTPLAAERVRAMVGEALTESQLEELERAGQVDLSLERPGLARFRVNVYRQQVGPDIVMRIIPDRVRDLEELGLGNELARFTTYHQGLVLVTGPTGCGKTSTLAALVKIINQERRDHIITAEDPIEYVHHSERCVVNQREVGRHSESFPRVLRAALREDPDVIVLGELRDLETVSLALTAAETGHLVLGTLHTGGAIRTISRLIGLFPPDEQDQVRVMLAESLRAVISQRLVPRADGAGRVPALEIMVVTRAIANLIREKKLFQIHSMLQTGRSKGMRLLSDSLDDLVKQGIVSKEETRRYA